MTIFPRPSEWSATRRLVSDSAGDRSQLYFAFLSYSHHDAAMAKWLHESLERFRVPSNLVGRLSEQGAVPRRLTPVFRDVGELAAAGDLGTEIREAIDASRFLIVLCSPAAAKSRWTNAEIEAFKRVRPESCVLAAIVSGEPFASDIEGREHEECLPPALRFHYDRRGRRTAKRTEPLAADLRLPGPARRLGLLKLIAGMLGVGLDDLVQRDSLRRQRRMAGIAAASLTGMVVASALAVTAIQARDEARDQRREAESLVGFMLGDLREKLEPVGRLDVLDSVGARALEYYTKQNKSGLSDESLAQRSKALTLMGEIAQSRGDFTAALRLYHEAYAGTSEAVRRDPDDPQRLFDHAQNVFWIGYIDWQRGRLDRAEAAFRAYRQLADRMMSLEPQNPQWRLEGKYADSNLGILLHDQRRFAEASDAFQKSLSTVEALAASEPGNGDYQKALLEALAWLADARKGEGRLDEAMAHRERQLALLRNLMAVSPQDKEYARKAMTAHKALSSLLAARGDMAGAIDHARRASAYADTLIRTEPGNTEWMEHAAVSRIQLGSLLRVAGDYGNAQSAVGSGCEIANRLAARDRTVRYWNEDLQLSCLGERSRMALATGASADAVRFARAAVALSEASRGKTPADAAIHRATAYLLAGNALSKAAQPAAARDAWRKAALSWPAGVTLEPDHLAWQAQSLRASGDASGARRIQARLNSIGYRHPEHRAADASPPDGEL